MDYKNYYEILGIRKDASATDIQKAYRSLARKYHPDVNKAPEAEARFKEIGEANEVLKDPEKRKKYDRYGSAWKNAQQTGRPPSGFEGFDFDFGGGAGGGGGGYNFEGAGQSGFSSFFDMLFGGARQGQQQGGPWEVRQPGGGGRGQRSRDRETTIKLSLEDLSAGGKRKIELLDPDTGQARTLEVNLPKGLRAGQKIRLAGQGGRGRDGSVGDLFLQVEARPHPFFSVDGLNLQIDVPVTPWTAALGGEISVKTLSGEIKVKLPAGSSSGKRIRLRGKGMPGKDEVGDLFATVQIVVPEVLSEREKELFEQLANESEFNV